MGLISLAVGEVNELRITTYMPTYGDLPHAGFVANLALSGTNDWKYIPDSRVYVATASRDIRLSSVR